MDTTSIVFTVLIGIIILLIVYSAKVAVLYDKLVRRLKLLPDISSDTIKSLTIAILVISIGWWITAMINLDWWQIVVIGLFIFLIVFVLVRMDTINANRRKDNLGEAVKTGIVEGIKEVRRLDQDAKEQQNAKIKTPKDTNES